MALVPNLPAVLKRVEQILPVVKDTLQRIDATLNRLDDRLPQLDRIPEIERELAALRKDLRGR